MKIFNTFYIIVLLLANSGFSALSDPISISSTNQVGLSISPFFEQIDKLPVITHIQIKKPSEQEILIPIDWEGSIEVGFKWLNSFTAIMFQDNGLNGKDHTYEGLCAIIDTKLKKIIFLDYVTTMFISSDGNFMFYVGQIGKRDPNYQHQLYLVDLAAIYSAKSAPLSSWKVRQEHLLNLSKQGIHESVNINKFEQSSAFKPISISDDKNGLIKSFLLSQPYFDLSKQSLYLVTGMGDSDKEISKAQLIKVDLNTGQISQKLIPNDQYTPSVLSMAARSFKNPYFKIIKTGDDIRAETRPEFQSIFK